jgi:TonB-dependent starch-binding outer membrane protein SusC
MTANSLRRTLIVIMLAALSTDLLAQSKLIKGKITSIEDGKSVELPGVNVVVEGSAKGTTSDVEGNYTIDVTAADKLLSFSFIGYQTKSIKIAEQTIINVILETDTRQLEEVVVVGYGVQKKSDITGSTANVKGDELYKQPVLTATQALQGKVAGVQIISSGQPGSSPQIRVRGVSTALAGTAALYVVDGVLTDDISNINTADIVDMNVLKDASSAAIYGSRGANGVIIITTKKGVSGKLVVSYNNNIGIRQAANLVEMANSAEYSNYVQAATGNIPPATNYNTDWFKTILRNAWQQNHNVSISGGSEKSTFLVNVGYLTDEGIVLDNDFKRLTIRVNQDFKINSIIKAGFQSSYTNSVNQNGFNNIDIDEFGNIGTVYNNAYRAAPIIASIVDGKYGNSSTYQNVGNPLLDIKNNSVRVAADRLQGSTFLEAKPLEWLTIKTSIGADWRNSLNRKYNYKFLADESTFLVAGGNQYNTRNSLNVKNPQSLQWVWDNIITASKKFDKHDVTLMVGTTAEEYRNSSFFASRLDVPADPSLWYIGVGDANSSQNEGGGDAWARNSYLARLNYSYEGKYLLTATIRSDGSSRLPKKYRWQQYPSVGLGWVLTREAFMQNQTIFDLLKLRTSFGIVGNDRIPTDAFSQTVALNKPYPFNGSVSDATNGVQINQIKDPNIKWETTEEIDFAIEFSALQSKLTGEINYYNKIVRNALMNVPIPRTVGDTDGVILTNVASIQNTGLEVLLNWKDQINTDFSYSIGGNVTFNTNKVVALNSGQAIRGGFIAGSQGFTTYSDNGLAIGSFYVLKTAGVFNSDAEAAAYTDTNGKMIQPTAKAGDFRYQDVNGDGIIDDNDRVLAGSYQPKAYYGINLTANYKSWDFSLSIYGNAGNQVYNGKRAVRFQGEDNIEKALVYNRWTSSNLSQTQPAANTGNQLASDYFVESGSFIRINNLTIGYTFPQAVLQRLKVASLRVYATSQNLVTLKEYSGFTPELPGDPLNSGIELSAYPTTRTIAVGLNVSF